MKTVPRTKQAETILAGVSETMAGVHSLGDLILAHTRLKELAANADKWMSDGQGALWSSEKHDWPTPPEIFDPLNAVFDFNLDPAASHEEHRCENYFTPAEDGLAQRWDVFPGLQARVFLNPPFDGVSAWLKKATDEALNRGVLVVALVASRTDTEWYQEYVLKQASYIVYIKGRITFKGAKNGAAFGSTIAVYEPGGLEFMDDPVSLSWDYKREPLPYELRNFVNSPVKHEAASVSG